MKLEGEKAATKEGAKNISKFANAEVHDKNHQTIWNTDHSPKEETAPTQMKSPAKQKRVSKKGTNIDELMDKATKFKGTKTLTPQTKSMKKTLEDIKPGMRRDIVPKKKKKRTITSEIKKK